MGKRQEEWKGKMSCRAPLLKNLSDNRFVLEGKTEIGASVR